MSILSEIGTFLLGVGSNTLNFLKGAILSLARNPQLQQIAMAAVTNAENLAISGLEKQAAAKSDVLGQLATAGLPAIAKDINLAIEAAVANLPVAVPITPLVDTASVAASAPAAS